MSNASEDLNWRNLLRLRVLEVADRLEGRLVTAREGAAELRKLADADISEMDEADIEIDFDADSPNPAALFALGKTSSQAPQPTDPVEIALARVVKLRDRNNGLKIVAETPGQEDVDAYRKSLEDLQKALNIATPVSQDKE
jgi:hypothetical protein